MSDNKFLKRLFQAYYKERQKNIPLVNLFERREFGFIPWEKQIMIRHVGFNNPENFKKYLIENGPKHVYSSGSLYLLPENPEMKKKKNTKDVIYSLILTSIIFILNVRKNTTSGSVRNATQAVKE